MKIVKLRKIEKEDIDELMDIFIDKDLLRAIGIELAAKKITRKNEQDYINLRLKEYKQEKPKEYHLVIVVDNHFSGIVGFNKIDYKNDSAEIGYWIGKKYWGKGIMTKAIEKFLSIAVKKFNLIRVEAKVFDFNKVSGRVLEKNGFLLEGRKKKSKKFSECYINEWMYGKVYL